MKIVALLTGRGNNTLKDKNILDVLGKPTLYYAAHAAKQSKLIDMWYCSSDDERILEAAEKYEGYKRIVRPPELATPTSQHIECIRHALTVMKENAMQPDILVVLLANNVTVKTSWIDACIQMMIDNPEATLDDLLEVIKGPDFPVGATIMGRAGIRQAYATGRGRIVVRSDAEIEGMPNGRQRIVVSSIPFQVNKALLM